MDLINELARLTTLLNEAIRQLGLRGKEYAATERDYRIALRQEILIERDAKTPVTIISDVCRGKREIAELKFKRDVAEVMYDAAKEAINGYKLQMRILEDQIEREWGKAE